MEAYNAALAIMPTLSDVRTNLGDLWRAQVRQQAHALAVYRALEAQGCDAKIASGGGRMYVTMDRYEVGQAAMAGSLTSALALEPGVHVQHQACAIIMHASSALWELITCI